jgi:hypothetical protein
VDEERQVRDEKQDSDGSEDRDKGNVHVIGQEPVKEEPMISRHILSTE